MIALHEPSGREVAINENYIVTIIGDESSNRTTISLANNKDVIVAESYNQIKSALIGLSERKGM